MIVAGVMSGTSADGIDVAIVRILGRGAGLRLRLKVHQHFPYPNAVRQAVLASMNAASASVADLAQLNALLGELYAQSIQRTHKGQRMKLDLIGCHGQTLYHQGEPAKFIGTRVATTWQTGEAAIIAAHLGVPVVSDFRPADMAVGGRGAPLVPLLDVAYYSHRTKLRVLQNLGGIGNLTIIPPGAHLGRTERVIAFDTGPGNMVIDACAQKLLRKPYDTNGAIAARGKVIQSALAEAMKDPFFQRKPPKTAGREQFGREFVAQFLRWCGPRAKKQDVLATATALTAASIGVALRQGIRISNLKTPFSDGTAEYVVSGGGSKNRTLMRMIGDEIEPLGFPLLTSDDLGMPAESKEAIAFALLAYQTWHRQPGNIPSATGAKRPVVLGKISYP
jgi:anhydro-N-acetylmuramic acid kinase